MLCPRLIVQMTTVPTMLNLERLYLTGTRKDCKDGTALTHATPGTAPTLHLSHYGCVVRTISLTVAVSFAASSVVANLS
jgi:hypothetical protein